MIGLKDIFLSARQESYRMRHFYMGAEHLFIALLQIKGGVASTIIQSHGLNPEYVTDAVRRKIGKGSKHRLWAGVPNTPRADILLDIAHELAMEMGREEPDERDLLTALLEEDDNIPVRVLKALGMTDIRAVVDAIYTHDSTSKRDESTFVDIVYAPEIAGEITLSHDHLLIIRRIFYGYPRIRIERQLTGGYSEAVLLVVTPLRGDQREDAPVVVKIDQTASILDETRRYETHVKRTLPPLTARLEEPPVAPENMSLAGIKYTLIAANDQMPQDLRTILGDWQPNELGHWLRNELFPAFGRIWWRQNRPYRFQAWQEYDWMLPPILTLDYVQDKQHTPDIHTLKFPVKRARLNNIEYGDMVAIESFTVQKVYAERNTIQLALGHGTDAAQAYKVEVRNLNLDENTYYRGEVIERITGTVWKTRDEQLFHGLRALEPDFSPEADKIPLFIDGLEKIPNPLKNYDDLLDRYVNGSLSTIHGDLHLGNIMIGPNKSAFLIDFAHSREGHTLFDWATLEVSLLSEVVMPVAGQSWGDARQVIDSLRHGDLPRTPSPINDALAVIHELRGISRECLVDEEIWSEYFVALALCSLRAIMWETMPVASRRLLFLVSGLAIHELRTRMTIEGDDQTPSPDTTDMNTSFN